MVYEICGCTSLKYSYQRYEKYTARTRKMIKKSKIYSRKAQRIWLSTYENPFTGRGIFYKSQESISLKDGAKHPIYYSKEALLL